MQLVEYLNLFLGALLNMMFYVIIIRYVFKEKVMENKYAVLLVLILCSFGICIVNIYNKEVFKILLTLPIVTLGVKKILKLNPSQALLSSIIATIYMFFGEVLAFTLMSILKVDFSNIYNNYFGSLFGAILMILATIPFLFITRLSKFFSNFIKSFEKRGISIIWITFLISIIIFSTKNFYNLKDQANPFVNIILISLFGFVIYLFYKEARKSSKISENYNALLTYLEKYEKEITEKRKIIHDYKNQLIIINGYADEKNKKLKDYISSIIEEQKNIPSDSLVKNVDNLPRGLKGIIYYKISQLDKSINVDITIRNKLKAFESISPKINKDTLKIIGVLLDNAIEAASKSKEKNINMEFKIENKEFILKIENSIYENVDNTKIMEPGFSTKGKGRGYGLSLVHDIVVKDKDIKLDINIKDNYFESTLSVILP